MIREDNITLQTLTEDLRTERITLKEYVTKSEGAALFTTALNKVLLDKYKSEPKAYNRVMKVITIGDGQGSDIKFPDINGINPAYVPELSEIPFANEDITSTTVDTDKYAIRVGISQEMIDDNECNLLGWNMEMLGIKMSRLEDEEAFKALHTYFSTGAALDTSVRTYKGRFDRGAYHLTGTLSQQLSATALGFEELIATGLNIMRTKTITLMGETYQYPVNPTTIVIHPMRELALAKVLNSTTIVMGTGVGGVTGNADQVGGGTNVFKGILNMVSTPFVGQRVWWMLDPARGSVVFVQRQTPQIEKQANWAYDAQEIRAISRFRAAVVEEKGLLPIQV